MKIGAIKKIHITEKRDIFKNKQNHGKRGEGFKPLFV
jgi:hypothetical protein